MNKTKEGRIVCVEVNIEKCFSNKFWHFSAKLCKLYYLAAKLE